MKTNRLTAVVFFLIVLLISFAVCGHAESQGVDFADQSDFLADMAEGINQRLASDTEDTSTMAWEELLKYNHKLVQIELAEIGKYDDQIFSDEKFDQIAHAYIDACKMQLLGSESERNAELYHALWDGAGKCCYGIIVTLYDRYDLPLTAAAVDDYRKGLSADAQENSNDTGTKPEAETAKIVGTQYTSKAIIRSVQEALNKRGYICGDEDGTIGLLTRGALRAYQERAGLHVNGVITDELLISLGIMGSAGE